MAEAEARTNWTKIADKRCAKDKPITRFTNDRGETFQIREHVYVDMGRKDQPYGIAFIHAFKARKDGLWMDIRWYYRFSDLPEEIQSPMLKDCSEDKCPPVRLKRLLCRELFASEILDSCLACYIVGRCCIVCYRNLREAQGFQPFPDTFYYLLTYNPHSKRLASTQGEIRIGPQFQATIPCCENELPKATKGRRGRGRKDDTVEREQCLWSASRASPMSHLDLVTYMQAVRSIAAFSSMCDRTANGSTTTNADEVLTHAQSDFITQLAFDSLHEADYNLKDAFELISRSSLLPPAESRWTEDDQKKFQRGIRQLGKNFYRIQRECLPEKKVSEVVEFYYNWKKTTQGIIMRPKRRLKPMLQRRAKNPAGNSAASLKSNGFCDQDESAENNLDSTLDNNAEQAKCQHCSQSDKVKLEPLQIDDKNQLYCSDCCNHFRRYGQLPRPGSVLELGEAPIEERLRDAMSPFLKSTNSGFKEQGSDEINAKLDPVDKTADGSMSIKEERDEEILVSVNDVIRDKENFQLVRNWNRGNENSCSRTDIAYLRKLCAPKLGDACKRQKLQSVGSVKEEKRIKSDFQRSPSTQTVMARAAGQYHNSPTLNKIYASNSGQLMQSPLFQHHLHHGNAPTPFLPGTNCPIQLSADTPALRQLRDIAAARSGCHFGPGSPSGNGPSSNPYSSATAVAIQQIMAMINNGQQPSASSHLLPAAAHYFNQSSGAPSSQREIDPGRTRRNSPVPREGSNAATHNHAHLHAHSHTHLHLNDGAGSSASPAVPSSVAPPSTTCPPLMMFTPGIHHSLYYQQLLNHAAAAAAANSGADLDMANGPVGLSAAGITPNATSLDLAQAMGYVPTGLVGNPFILPHSPMFGYAALQPNAGGFCPPSSAMAAQSFLAAQQQQHAMLMMLRSMPPEHAAQYQQALQQQLFLAAATTHRPVAGSQPIASRLIDLKPSCGEDMPILLGRQMNESRGRNAQRASPCNRMRNAPSSGGTAAVQTNGSTGSDKGNVGGCPAD